MWDRQARLEANGFERVAGIDEAGRGPLAGPVVAAAVVLPAGCDLQGIDDSKKLTEKKREALFEVVKEMALGWSVGIASVEEIDSLNILQATFLAMRRAVEGLSLAPDALLIDGNQRIPRLNVFQQAVVGGDASCACIAAASILAKVTRDRMMREMHVLYPVYGFDKHKGYYCQTHVSALNTHGACPYHRRSFEPVASLATRAAAEDVKIEMENEQCLLPIL